MKRTLLLALLLAALGAPGQEPCEETQPPLLLAFRAADAAVELGDEQEAGRQLLEAAREAGELLSPQERLLLARLAERRGDRKGAILQYGHALVALMRRGERTPAWIGERIRRLDAEEEAGSVPIRTFPSPPEEARRSFASARKALEKGNLEAAREGFRKALRLGPGYAEAALALGALEARTGRTSEAIAAYRTALASDPERFEAVSALADLLWAEPDRADKQESLALLDRAVALRPDIPRLLRESAERSAAWGDAEKALERLDAWRARATEAERKGTDPLRERLARAVGHGAATSQSWPAAPASPAAESYRLAQVLFRRGDEASLDSSLNLLAEAGRLDPSFAPAKELLASILEKRGDLVGAEEALKEALSLDPANAATHERLAAFLATLEGRRAEARRAWEMAEAAGSREALFRLAEIARRENRFAEARRLLRRYLEDSPGGPHADEARDTLGRWESRRRALFAAAGAAALVLLAAGLALLVRRRSGFTLGEWLGAEPGEAREARGALGRLRHEALKHGGLLLGDTIEDLSGGEREAGRQAVELLLARLFGTEERGLLAEARTALSDLTEQARARGYRLNLRHKDPLLSPVVGALDELEKSRGPLEAAAAGGNLSPRAKRALLARLRRAAAALGPATGQAFGRLLDEVGSTTVDRASLEELLSRAALEASVPAPPLEFLGLLADGITRARVRIDRGDWETIFRNLFANALASGREAGMGSVALGVSTEGKRDPVTGQRRLLIVLLDDVPRALTAEMIRGRAAERGLGVVADLVRRNDGEVDVGPPPPGAEARYVKGIRLTFPAPEEEA